jgi:hypothetical protein
LVDVTFAGRLAQNSHYNMDLLVGRVPTAAKKLRSELEQTSS